MNYQRIYDQIVDRARKEKRVKIKGGIYYEAHHIVPKCIGGEGHVRQWKTHPNIVLLTAREHFICHWLLCRIYPKNRKLGHAFWFMSKQNAPTQKRDYTVSSRTYAEAISTLQFTEEHKEKIRETRVGKKTIVHPQTKEIKYVLQEDLQTWIDLGWENTNKRKKHILCKCTNCGKAVSKQASHIKSSVFCNRECYLLNKGMTIGEVHVYRDTLQKFIPKNKVQEYLDNGWQKGRKSLQKEVLQYTIEHVLLEKHPSVKSAVKSGNFSCTGISECANGKRKTHRGFIWKYVN